MSVSRCCSSLGLPKSLSAKRKSFGYFRQVLLATLLVMASVVPALAQVASFTQTDIGSPGATGTYAYSSGTYTVSGAGTGIGGTSDSFTYVNANVNGNIEIVAKVNSQTNTSNYATAGLMIRDSLNANAANAMISVSPANGVNFTARTTDGGTSTTTLGPTVAAPVFLRLVRSRTSIAGYESPDGVNWTQVGSSTITLPYQYYAGFAVSSNSYGNLSTAVFSNVNLITNVPQRSNSMQLWLRGDFGVVANGTSVTQWTDQSVEGNNAVQTTSGSRPTIVTNAVNGLPALSFNGSSQFLNVLGGVVTNGGGLDIFVVTKPTTVVNNATLLGFLSSPTGVNFFEATTNNANFSVTTSAGTTAAVGTSAITTGQFQLLEASYSGNGSATIFSNGVQKEQTILPHLGRELSCQTVRLV